MEAGGVCHFQVCARSKGEAKPHCAGRLARNMGQMGGEKSRNPFERRCYWKRWSSVKIKAGGHATNHALAEGHISEELFGYGQCLHSSLQFLKIAAKSCITWRSQGGSHLQIFPCCYVAHPSLPPSEISPFSLLPFLLSRVPGKPGGGRRGGGEWRKGGRS